MFKDYVTVCYHIWTFHSHPRGRYSIFLHTFGFSSTLLFNTCSLQRSELKNSPFKPPHVSSVIKKHFKTIKNIIDVTQKCKQSYQPPSLWWHPCLDVTSWIHVTQQECRKFCFYKSFLNRCVWLMMLVFYFLNRSWWNCRTACWTEVSFSGLRR